MIPIVDYHIHTSLCGHASGSPEDYVKQAISVGLREIGFSDHAPLVTHEDRTLTMGLEELPHYHAMIRRVQEQFSDFSVKLGIEADFIPGYEEKTKAILDGYPYDYVFGSVHYIRQWGFDKPDEKERWEQQNVNEIYRLYHELLRQSAQSGLYDIMGHVDLVKKFGNRATIDLSDEIRKTAEVFKQTGVAIEVNSSGLRKPVHEIYPSLADLTIYCQAGVPITFGSDAHHPTQVGQDFDKAMVLAREAGYKEYVLFRKRKIEKTVEF